MGEAIGQTLPLAVGVALSPASIIAVVLILSTERARGNGVAFVIGALAGVFIVGGLLLLLNRGADASDQGSPAEWTSYGKIALGILLLGVAHRQRGKRPAPGEDASLPGWMEKLDGFNPAQSAAAGFVLDGINPKNLILTAGAATAIAQTGASTGDQTVALVVYALIAGLGVLVPLGIYLFMGGRADALLGRLKDSMTRNNGVIVAVICVVIAAKLIGDGITTLSLF